jgi:hypothetical protein
MNKESKNETNENIPNESKIEEDRNYSNFYPTNEKTQINYQKNSNVFNIQNSSWKNFKNECANSYM